METIWKNTGWEDNIKMDLKEIGINTRNWVDLAQDRDYCTAIIYICIYYRNNTWVQNKARTDVLRT